MLPFPTAVVAAAFQYRDVNDERTAIVLYDLVAAAAAATWLALCHFLSRAPYLLEDEAHTAFFAAERRRAVFGVTLYALSALVAAWSPVAGLVIACILPVFYGLTSTGWRFPGRRPRPLRPTVHDLGWVSPLRRAGRPQAVARPSALARPVHHCVSTPAQDA